MLEWASVRGARRPARWRAAQQGARDGARRSGDKGEDHGMGCESEPATRAEGGPGTGPRGKKLIGMELSFFSLFCIRLFRLLLSSVSFLFFSVFFFLRQRLRRSYGLLFRGWRPSFAKGDFRSTGDQLGEGSFLVDATMTMTIGVRAQRHVWGLVGQLRADVKKIGDLGTVAQSRRSTQRTMFAPAKLTVAGTACDLSSSVCLLSPIFPSAVGVYKNLRGLAECQGKAVLCCVHRRALCCIVHGSVDRPLIRKSPSSRPCWCRVRTARPSIWFVPSKGLCALACKVIALASNASTALSLSCLDQSPR